MSRRDFAWYPGHGPPPARGSKSTTAAVPVYEKAEETMSEQETKPTYAPLRRARIDQNTPAELAIRAAVEAVEAVGADTRLTDAVNLLQAARDKVADFVDGVERPATPSAADVTLSERFAFVLEQWQKSAPAKRELAKMALVNVERETANYRDRVTSVGYMALADAYAESEHAIDAAHSLLAMLEPEAG